MKRAAVYFLSFIIILSMAAEMPLAVFAKKSKSSSSKKNEEEEKINSQIKEDEQAIEGAESEKDKIRSDIDDVEKVISSLETQKDDIEGYVRQLDASLSQIQTQINGYNDRIDELDIKVDEIDGRISSKQDDVKDATALLEEAEKQRQASYEDTKQHIKYMYMTRSSTMLEVLLQSEGIKDMLNRVEYIGSMADYDRQRLSDYAKAVADCEEKRKKLREEEKELGDLKEELEGTRDEINGEKEKVKEKEADVSKLISAKENEINIYNASILSKEQQIEEYKKQIAEQDAIIKALEASIAARRAQLAGDVSGNEAESGLRKYDGGKFTFPAPSYTRISDDYGNRVHPILGVTRFHNGVDLAAPSGSPILAAYDGTVIAAAYSATMGNYIMIDHGDDLYTIYMHASSLLVSNGASVGKGQKIALVGSTGRSTGPHLHFSVRQGGNYVSPWNYLK